MAEQDQLIRDLQSKIDRQAKVIYEQGIELNEKASLKKDQVFSAMQHLSESLPPNTQVTISAGGIVARQGDNFYSVENEFIWKSLSEIDGFMTGIFRDTPFWSKA